MLGTKTQGVPWALEEELWALGTQGQGLPKVAENFCGTKVPDGVPLEIQPNKLSQTRDTNP